MPIETINRTARRLYEEEFLQEIKKQLYITLFPEEDTNNSEKFLLNPVTPAAVARTSPTSPPVAIEYIIEGSGLTIRPPRLAQKTQIDRELKDRAIAGVEAADGFRKADVQRVRQIIQTHIANINITKNKQAIDVFAKGKFLARGLGDADLGMDIPYNRNSSLDLTYDFRSSGARMDSALSDALNALSKFGAPLEDVIVLLGRNWIRRMFEDEGIKQSQANLQNVLASASLLPEKVQKTEGLKILATYQGSDMITPVSFCSYIPSVPFKAPGASSYEPYIPDNMAIVFSLQSKRYRVNRGIGVFDGGGNSRTVTGEVAIDTYNTPDPPVEYIRSQSRHIFVPDNINHTAVITGTFSSTSSSGEGD